MSRKFTLLIVVVSLLSFVLAINSHAEEFEIKHADSLEADQKEINIKGNVLINYKGAVIEAPQGKVETNDDGQAEKATFFGRAKLKLNDRKLEADNIIISIDKQLINAEGNTISELKDKKNNKLTIQADSQELLWSGENATASGNIKTIYQDTKVLSDKVTVIYKNKRPNEAVFLGSSKQSNLEQPTNITFAKEISFDLDTHNVLAKGNVKSTIWPDEKTPREKQDAVFLSSEELYIDNNTGITTAKGLNKKTDITYQETRGESNEAYLLKKEQKPEKIIFKGKANVSQADKELSSEEVIFSFKDKKLTSNTTLKTRPKTLILKTTENKKL